VNLIDVLSQDVNIECNFYQLVRAKKQKLKGCYSTYYYWNYLLVVGNFSK